MGILALKKAKNGLFRAKNRYFWPQKPLFEAFDVLEG